MAFPMTTSRQKAVGSAVTESELRARVVTLAHAAGWRVFCLPIAKARRPVKDAVGYPDLTLARRGIVMWIELKADKGVLSVAQEAWYDELSPRCYVVRVSELPYLARLLA